MCLVSYALHCQTVAGGQPYIFYGRLLKEKQGYKMEQPAIFTPEKYLTLRDATADL